MIHCVKPVSD